VPCGRLTSCEFIKVVKQKPSGSEIARRETFSYSAKQPVTNFRGEVSNEVIEECRYCDSRGSKESKNEPPLSQISQLKGDLSMKSAILRKLLIIMVVSLALVAAPEAFGQEEEEIQEMPKEGDISSPSGKGAPPPKVKTMPSVKATPIEIPGKNKPVIKTKPSVGATPIEIPGKNKPVIKTKPSVGATPIEIPGKK